MDWLNVFKHLLPNARAWRIAIDKALRQFFDGLTDLPAGIQNFYDLIYLDLLPQSTRQLSLWEDQFALPETGLTEQERRDRLDATWKALGGQAPRYLQDTLQAAGFDVYVHEWWDPINEPPVGVQVCVPARNPHLYLTGGAPGVGLLMFDGGADSQDGDTVSQDGSTSTPVGYPLVNKVVTQGFISDGNPEMQDGDAQAQDGAIVNDFVFKTYILPTDPDKYHYFLYIGGATFPDQAAIPLSRRDEFEDLCLKICPLQLWLGILVTYS